MNEQDQPLIIESEPETQDKIEEKQRLKTAFADMEKNQLVLLDSAGKSIIERVATFLAILFGVTAFGSNFPPAYLKNYPLNKYLIIVILLCYLVAMALGMLAIQPRNYSWHRYQAKEMAKTLQGIIAYKKRLVEWAGILFALGTVLLAVLIVSLILKV
jgi:p-aminobenzoyl-glutamate transporter AbgT